MDCSALMYSTESGSSKVASEQNMGDITVLLEEVRQGKQGAEDRLMELVYGELHRLASAYMRRERQDHTLQSSALVNEAYLRLIGGAKVSWESRGHFFVAAARTMRRTLIDHARSHATAKREHVRQPLDFQESLRSAADSPEGMIDLDQALNRLAEMDPRQARIVELRFFAGLTVEETAELLGISEKTVKRDWATARAWLEAELTEL